MARPIPLPPVPAAGLIIGENIILKTSLTNALPAFTGRGKKLGFSFIKTIKTRPFFYGIKSS